jgi:predicted nucleic acid-binding protein
MVLELAVAAQANIIVTYNKNDFQGVEEFGMDVLTPKEFLERIGGFS